MQVVILAAGKGKRLQPFTLTRSKAMAPIVGKPMVARVLDSIIINGLRDVIFVVSEEDTEIIDYFEKNYKSKIDVRFAVQKERLGMANALESAKDLIQEDFLLSACDSLVSSEHIKNIVNRYQNNGTKGVLSLIEVPKEKISSTGIVEFDECQKIKRIVEKPSVEEAPSNVSSLPIYVFSKDIMSYLPKIKMSKRGEYELQDGIQMMIDDCGPIEGIYADYRLNLTNIDDLLKINLRFLGELEESVVNSDIPENVKIIDPVYIDKGAEIGENCIIGPNVYIESDTIINDHAKLKDTIVLRGSEVEIQVSSINKAFL